MGQPSPSGAAVLTLRLTGSGFLQKSPTSATGATLNETAMANAGLNNPASTRQDVFMRLEPGKVYSITTTVSVSGSYTLSTSQMFLHVEPPLGYRAVIDQAVRTTAGSSGNNSHTFSVRILGSREAVMLAAGASSSIDSNRLFWQVGLGGLLNGDSAGSLCLTDPSTYSDWAAFYTPAALQYDSSAPSEVLVYRVGSAIRQIIANQAAVDIETLSATQYKIHFYHPDSVQGSGFPRTFTGLPYITYTVEKGGSETSLKITSASRNITSATDTEATAPVVRTAVTDLTRSGTWPNFSWTKQEWNTEGKDQLVEVAATPPENGNSTSGVRDETTQVRVPDGAVALQFKRTYTQHAWGEEITAEQLGSDAANGSTATEYYSTSTDAGYQSIKSITRPDGSWVAYDYYSGPGYSGAVKHIYRPFGPTTTPVALDEGQGEVTYYEYEKDPFNLMTRTTKVETTIGPKIVARTSYSYGTPTATNGMFVVPVTRSDYFDGTHSLDTVTNFYREDVTDAFFTGKTHSVKRPDGVQLSYVYQRGTYDAATHEFTSSASGKGSRIAVITGITGTAYASYDGYSIEPLTLIANKSTMEVTIRDARALVVRTETHVWASNGENNIWNLVRWTNLSYDKAGHLTGRAASNGTSYGAHYNGEQKDYEYDEANVRFDYEYDAAGRLHKAKKSGGPTTTYSPDAAGNMLGTELGASSTAETISNRQGFDDAGRLTSATPAGLSATGIAYDVAARTETHTAPDGGTTVRTYRPDGRLASLTGSSVVATYYSYVVEDDGKQTVQTNVGASDSSRWSKTSSDWLGRTATRRQPGFANQGDMVEENTYSPSTGLLEKTTRTGYAATCFGYDEFAMINRTGLDLSGGDGLVLASADRVTETDTVYEKTGSAWWLTTTRKIYPFTETSAGTSVTASTRRERLTGFAADQLAEIHEVDAERNDVALSTTVDPSTKTVTTTQTGACECAVATSKIVNGLATETTTRDGLTYKTYFDALERKWKEEVPRNNNTTTFGYKTNSALPTTEKLVKSATESLTVRTLDYDSSGRVKSSRDAGSHYTRFKYNKRGQVTYQWGDGAYPLSFGYDPNTGERTSLKTYRAAAVTDAADWPATVGDADETKWIFDPYTGLLSTKTDAGSKTVKFSYNSRGQPAWRKWARKKADNSAEVLATYDYDPGTGELTSISYNDGTDGVAYSYTRLGQLKTVGDATGNRVFAYDSATPWRVDNETLPGFFGSRVLTSLYDTSAASGTFHGVTSGKIVGRAAGFKLGSATDAGHDLTQSHTYTATGRFLGVSSSVGTAEAQDFVYSYVDSSRLLAGLTAGDFAVSYDYETKRDLRTKVASSWSGASRARFDSAYNDLGQRQTVKQSGSAYGDYFTGQTYQAVFHDYTFNARGELETDALYRGDTASHLPDASKELPGRRFEYRYDSLGNRSLAGTTGTSGPSTDSFTPDARNRYATVTSKFVRILGTAAPTANVTVEEAAATSKRDNAWAAFLAPDNTNGPVQGTAHVYANIPGSTDVGRTNRSFFAPKASQAPTYDDDGNLKTDGVWEYFYDAENRLVRMTSTLPESGGFTRLQVDFKYDYLGRRVEKIVQDLATNNMTSARYVYNGWNVVAELDGTGTNLLRSFTWGLDLAGSLGETGGIGALLQITNHQGLQSWFVCHDANGNVAALVDASSGTLAAVYEYGPFGELLRSEGAQASANPFRFSTKWQDDETGLIYYGLRYYSSRLGRFITRDPIGEQGGVNLYGFVGNDAVNRVDYLGARCWGVSWQNQDGTYVYTVVCPPNAGPILGGIDSAERSAQAQRNSALDTYELIKQDYANRRTRNSAHTDAAPNNEALKKECAELASIIARGENKMHDLRQSFDSKSGYYRGLAKNFAKDNYEFLNNGIDFFKDAGGDLGFEYGAGKLLPGGLDDFAGELKDTTVDASDGKHWSTIGHLALATYYVTNIVRPSIYRTPNFRAISRLGGGALLIGGVAIKAYEHFGSTAYNEWQQHSIMQAGYGELYSLRSQYSTEEHHVGKFREEYKAKGCDKL